MRKSSRNCQLTRGNGLKITGSYVDLVNYCYKFFWIWLTIRTYICTHVQIVYVYLNLFSQDFPLKIAK